MPVTPPSESNLKKAQAKFVAMDATINNLKTYSRSVSSKSLLLNPQSLELSTAARCLAKTCRSCGMWHEA